MKAYIAKRHDCDVTLDRPRQSKEMDDKKINLQIITVATIIVLLVNIMFNRKGTKI